MSSVNMFMSLTWFACLKHNIYIYIKLKSNENRTKKNIIAMPAQKLRLYLINKKHTHQKAKSFV